MIVEDLLGVEDAIRIIRESLDLCDSSGAASCAGSDLLVSRSPARIPLWVWWIPVVLIASFPLGLTPVPQWDRVHLVPFTDPADKVEDFAVNILLFLPFRFSLRVTVGWPGCPWRQGWCRRPPNSLNCSVRSDLRPAPTLPMPSWGQRLEGWRPPF